MGASGVANWRGAFFDWTRLTGVAAFAIEGLGCVFFAGCALVVFGFADPTVWVGRGAVSALIGSGFLVLAVFGAGWDLVEVVGLAIELRFKMQISPRVLRVFTYMKADGFE